MTKAEQGNILYIYSVSSHQMVSTRIVANMNILQPVSINGPITLRYKDQEKFEKHSFGYLSLEILRYREFFLKSQMARPFFVREESEIRKFRLEI